jgi:hypothetical protein
MVLCAIRLVPQPLFVLGSLRRRGRLHVHGESAVASRCYGCEGSANLCLVVRPGRDTVSQEGQHVASSQGRQEGTRDRQTPPVPCKRSLSFWATNGHIYQFLQQPADDAHSMRQRTDRSVLRV